jgi:hypothetical protein
VAMSRMINDLEVNVPTERVSRLSKATGYSVNSEDTVELCLTQVDRWRHSVSDVVEYVTTEKVTKVCSTFSWDHLLSIAACILNGQSPRCYSQYENIVCSVGMKV